MNKTEFMRQLERLLQNISEQERREALQYYEDYFADAGPENEQAVIEALGNPARVAENIRRDLYGAGYGDNYEARKPVTGRELTEYGAAAQGMGATSGPAPGPAATVTASAAGPGQSALQSAPTWEDAGTKGKRAGKEPMSGGMIALIVILCIIALPIAGGLLAGAVGVLGGVLGVAVSLIAAWFCLILGFGIAALVCFIVGVVISVAGIAGMGLHPLAGLGLVGGGFITVGLGIFFMMLTVAMAGIVTPAMFRGIGRLFSGRKGRKKKA